MVQYSERSLLPWISCCSRKLQPKSDAVCFLMVPHVHEHTCCKNGRMRTHTHIPTYPHYTYVFFLLFVSDLQLYYIERSKCWLSLRVGRYETLGLRSGLLDKTHTTQQLWDPSLFPLLHFAYRQVLSLTVRGKHLLTSMLTIFPMTFLLIVFDISALI